MKIAINQGCFRFVFDCNNLIFECKKISAAVDTTLIFDIYIYIIKLMVMITHVLH